MVSIIIVRAILTNLKCLPVTCKQKIGKFQKKISNTE